MNGDHSTRDESATTDELVGQVLDGRYRVLRPLDRGGMGAVFVAQQLNIERLVAVKVMRSDDAVDAQMVSRFRSEAQIISTLRHPNTLKLFDYGVLPDGRLYLVTELLSGEPLSKVVKRGPLAIQRTLEILKEVCLSLAEAHGRGVIHRDLKPGNIFLEKVGSEEVVKVLDFGIAKVGGQLAGDTQETARGTLMGTPAYISPEQAYGRPVEPRTDLYSLGVVGYYCLSGKLPFSGEAISQIAAHAEDQPPSFKQIGALQKVPAAIEALVLKMMSKDPAGRPASATQLAADLEVLMTSLERRAPPTSKVRWWLMAVGIWMLVGVAGGVWYARASLVSALDAGVPDAGDDDGGGLRDATDADAAEPDSGQPKIRISDAWRNRRTAEALAEDVHEALDGCRASVPLTVRLESKREGNTISVEPKWPETEAFRDCLLGKLDDPLKWPDRKGDEAWIEVDVLPEP